MQLVGKALTTDGKNKKLYLVAEVKYIEEYDQVCCCCVSNKTGNIDDMKLLAVDAKEKVSMVKIVCLIVLMYHVGSLIMTMRFVIGDF